MDDGREQDQYGDFGDRKRAARPHEAVARVFRPGRVVDGSEPVQTVSVHHDRPMFLPDSRPRRGRVQQRNRLRVSGTGHVDVDGQDIPSAVRRRRRPRRRRHQKGDRPLVHVLADVRRDSDRGEPLRVRPEPGPVLPSDENAVPGLVCGADQEKRLGRNLLQRHNPLFLGTDNRR